MADLMFRYAREEAIRLKQSSSNSIDDVKTATNEISGIQTSDGFAPKHFFNTPHPHRTTKRKLQDFLPKD